MQANILYLYPVPSNLADSVYKTTWCLYWKTNAPHAYTLWVNFRVLLGHIICNLHKLGLTYKMFNNY